MESSPQPTAPDSAATTSAEDHLVHPPAPGGGTSKLTIVLCVLAGMFLAVLVGVGVYYWYYFHGRIRPTELSTQEQEMLSDKLEVVTGQPVVINPNGIEQAGQGSVITTVEAGEPVVEAETTVDPAVFADDRRTLILTEREINGFLHHNTELAERLKIELGTDEITAQTIVDFPEETPMVGGRTVRVNFTVGAFLDTNGKLVVEIRDISAGGIPIPNAWLGDIKNKNLIEMGDNFEGSGILRKISEGIADFQVEDGQIRIRLNE